jgi:hypothetical protein
MEEVREALSKTMADPLVLSGRMIGEDRFAYVMLLTSFRARICLSEPGDMAAFFVADSW